jgi:hypothetical protein
MNRVHTIVRGQNPLLPMRHSASFGIRLPLLVNSDGFSHYYGCCSACCERCDCLESGFPSPLRQLLSRILTMDSCGHRQLEPCFQSGLRIVSINATNQCFKGQAGFENLGRRILRQPWTSDYETVVPLAGGCRREDRWKLRLSLFPFFREAG